MRHGFARPAVLAAVLVGMLAPAVSAAADTGRFDGTWLTAITCGWAEGARYYRVRFTSTVKDGILHGQHGTPGEPKSLQLDGRIAADGAAILHVLGRAGDPAFSTGQATPEGTPYGYDVDAHFQGSSGTGTRTSGRACKLEMEKQ